MEKSGSERRDPRIDDEESLTNLFRDAIVTFGTTHPDGLPTDDPTVKAINERHNSWIRAQAAEAERLGTIEAQLEMSLKVTPFLVESGFTHPDYVEEVVNDDLAQDLAQAEELGLTDLADRIRAKREELLRLI